MIIKIKQLAMQNFKGFKDFSVNFTDRTTVSGMNGIGKTTVVTAYMWLLFGIGYDLGSNPNVRREVNKEPINDVDVSIEAILDIDGKEVKAKKVQKRTVKKDDSFSDDNKYFINDVPKNSKDFVEYFGFDFDIFRLCANPNAFLNQKSKEMREFLFSLVDNVTDYDVACKSDELKELAVLLEKYTVEELSAMNKASKTKLQNEINGIQPRIDEVNRSIVEINVSDLELQKNSLKEQITEIEKQEDDSTKAFEQFSKFSDDIMQLKFKQSDIERTATEELNIQKREIQKRIDEADRGLKNAINQFSNVELDIKKFKDGISRYEVDKKQCGEEYMKVKTELFDMETATCPTCGQEFPQEKTSELMESFEKKKAERLKIITDNGFQAKNAIEKYTKEVAEFEKQLETLKADKIKFNAEKGKAMEELAKLPLNVDLSMNQDYEALTAEINQKELALKEMNNGADYRSQLRIKRLGLTEELNGVQKKLDSADNSKAEERIAELREQHKKLEQDKADCEKVLNWLDELDKKKNELLVESINNHFSIVKWDLFDFNKNGTYKKDYCVPTVDGFRFGDSTNEGREIAAKLDICNSIQKIKGINCPVFLDRAESINDWNIPDMDCQLVLLRVTTDKELKVEVE